MYTKSFDLFFLVFSILLSVYIMIDFVLNAKNKWHKKITFWWSLPVSIILLESIVIISIFEYFSIRRHVNYTISLVGLVLFLIAFLLRIWSRQSLKEFYSSHIQLRDDHKLIEKGPYRLMRHPYYFSIIIGSFSFPLIANAYFSATIAFLTLFPLLIIRCFAEETLLLQKFDTQYLQYQQKTPMFIYPKIKIKI